MAYCNDPYKKGLDRIIQAWAIADLRGGFSLHIIGIECERATRYLADAGQVVPANVFFVGPLPHAAFLHHLQAASVYLAAARYEDFGIAPLEALAVGLILVTLSSPGNFEARGLMADIAPDLLAPEGDVRALAEALVKAVNLPRHRRESVRKLSIAATRSYSEQAALDRMRDTIVPALREMALEAQPGFGWRLHKRRSR